MRDTPPKIIAIPAKPELAEQKAVQRQLRVAAYCRVSTKEEEQLTSFEHQQAYYTEKIMTTKDWTMAGIFADEGITGTKAKKRPEFLRMIEMCKRKKIDLILTKSISRFARNTLDCLKYIRELKEQGIGIYFEEQNINTLDAGQELFLTIYGAFAQAESENISANVRWGQRQAMRQGRVRVRWGQLYGFEKGEDGEGRVIPEQAEVVQRIYREFLAGASIRMIVNSLEADQIPNKAGEVIWHTSTIRSILANEKYCGDVLAQKTFVGDCIEGKTYRNQGQLPQYYIPDHHEAIVSRDTFNRAQAEMARRNAQVSPSSKRAPTGRGCFTSKFALSERLICGECGNKYRHCVWSKRGKKRMVWRCCNRVDYGSKVCHHSPTLDELQLQAAILKAINTAMSRKDVLIRDISGAMELELAPTPGETMSLADIERRLDEIEPETMQIIIRTASTGRTDKDTELLRTLVNEAAVLKEKRAYLQEQQKNNAQAHQRIREIADVLKETPAEITEWDESLIRQLVEMVKVLSADRILVRLRGGVQIEQDML